MVKNAFGDRDLQENYLIVFSYVFLKNFQDFSRTFSLFSFARTFPGLEINFFHFLGFPECVGTLYIYGGIQS